MTSPFRSTFLLIALTVAWPLRAEPPLREVGRQDFNQLWILAPERMDAMAPPLVRETSHLIRKYGEIHVEHEFIVDAEGRPSGYRFIGIEPPGVDPLPFQAMAMFLRYRPVAGVAATPVRFRDRDLFHWPRPAGPGEE